MRDEIDETHFFRTICWRLYSLDDLRRLRWKISWYMSRKGRQRLKIARKVMKERREYDARTTV